MLIVGLEIANLKAKCLIDLYNIVLIEKSSNNYSVNIFAVIFFT